jgi:3-phenylpropionate/trans-cinnamate dioxygenase ferredoxin reductase component
MPKPDSCHVIVGANLAGGRAAEALRQGGYEGRVVLVGAEPDRPYERPPLSKEYLRGETPDEKLYLQTPTYYEEQRIEMRLGMRATRLDVAARVVTIEGGEGLAYDKLLIATGCEVRRLTVPGSELEGLFYLRTRGDSERLGAEIQRARRVVVIGAGFIGSEVAASARTMGREVTLLEAAPVPLARALGPRMGEYCAGIHRDHGVDLRLGCGVSELLGSARVEEVVLANGSRIACDLVVVGVGVAPAVSWLDGSGLALENGVVVDEYCESSVPGVYAAGDVANAWNPLFSERLRVEHYDNAQNQGLAAGKSMAGRREPYAPVPYFWSDQYDMTLQYVGHGRGDDEIVVRGDVGKRSFVAFYVRAGRLRAALGIGRPRDVMAAKRLVQARKPVDPKLLADEQVDLRTLTR